MVSTAFVPVSRLSAKCSLAALAAVLALPAVASAQQVADDSLASNAREGGEASADAIVVTGSRIARDGFKTATPVTIVGAEAINRQAATNIADVLNQLPAFRPQATPATTAIFIGNAGANLADLRGIGAQRTLVLVDGRRFVPGTVAGSGNAPGFTVDLNMIPTALIARSEVVTGGASAAYGSDAVAGVVNLILDKDLTGVKLSGQSGFSDRGDNIEYSGSLATGTRFAEGRGHVLFGGEYVKSKGVGDCYERSWCGDYEYGPVGNPIPQVNGLPRQILLPNVRPSLASYNGLITAGPLAGTEFLPDGSTFQHDYGTYYGVPIFQSGGSIDPKHGFYDEFPLKSPVERYNLLGRLSYEFSPVLTAVLEASYGHIKGTTIGAQTRNLGDITIYRDNPFLPAAVAARMDAAAVTSFRFGRIGNDLGHSYGSVERDTYRIVAGGNGELGAGWKWDAYYQYGQTDYAQRGYNTRKNREFFLATDAVRDLATGDIVCRSTLTNPGNGCAPLNLFGENNFSAAAHDYAYGTVRQDTKLTQHVAAFNIQGDLFQLPGGALAVATGVEYRVEDVQGASDPDSAANNFYTSPGSGITGPATKVKEGYVEVAAPLASDVAFARFLELNGAVRLTDYSTSGSEVTWKLGAVWEPIEGVRLRATRSRDIRAPNFFELNNPVIASFQFLVDPLGSGGSSLTAVTLSGNPALQPEKADTFTAGVVLSPSSRLRFAVDYYDIKLDGAISTLGGQTILNRCASGATELCALVNRDGAGNLLSVDNTRLNLNQVKTRGLDLEASYTMPAGAGDLSLRLLGTYVFDLITVDSSGSTDRAGQNGSPVSQESGVPDFIGTAYLNYAENAWQGGVEVRYISAGLYDVTKIGPHQDGYAPTLPNSISDNKIGSYWYVNANLAFNVWEGEKRKAQLFGRVDNLLDKDPPNNIPSSYGVTNPVLYDVVGRTYKIGMRVNF